LRNARTALPYPPYALTSRLYILLYSDELPTGPWRVGIPPAQDTLVKPSQPESGKKIVVISAIHVCGHQDLLVVVQISHHLRAVFRAGQGWQQQGRQNGNDGDNHQHSMRVNPMAIFLYSVL